MRAHTAPTSAARPTPAAAAVAAALALLAAPEAGRAANKTFAANSLIIPAQIEYQSDGGLLSAYAMIYTVLLKNDPLPTGCTKPVTFYWAISPNKLSQYRCNTNTNALPDYSRINDNDGCDFVVQSADGVPVAQVGATNAEVAPFNVWLSAYAAATGPARGVQFQVSPTTKNCNGVAGSPTCPRTVMKYLGGAWVVDATDRQCFLGMLQNVPELAQYHKNGATDPHWVEIHSARATFTAPVARMMNQRAPRIAVVGPSAKAAFLESVLSNSGLDAIANWDNGVVFDYGDETTMLSSTATDLQGKINSLLDGKPRYGLLWGVDAMTVSAAQMTNIDFFLDQGFGAYIEANSIDAIENTTGMPLLTTTGVNTDNPNIAYYDDCNDRASTTTFFHSAQTGTCFKYGALAQPWTQTGNTPFTGGQGNYKGYHPLAAWQLGVSLGLVMTGSPDVAMAAARYKDDKMSNGLVIYLSGMRFDNARYWGERMIMNSVLANVPVFPGVELARSEPVGYHDAVASPATDRVYQGTYVQMPDPSEADLVNFSASFPQRWQFPYTAGHLYEYDLANIPAGSTSFACGTTGTTGACPTVNWDGTVKMPLPGARKMFTALGGSAHLGWKIIPFDYTQTQSGCVSQPGTEYCMLSYALAQCNAAGVNMSNLFRYTSVVLDAVQQRQTLGGFVQQVRGYCSAHNPKMPTLAYPVTSIMQPTDAQCDSLARQNNRAKLGGVDHGSPAIVGPSRYVTDTAYVKRPVVAYVGARDGMLHALYVSGGTDWIDPQGRSLPSGIQQGQELWAFVPPTQLCGLSSNNAMVDASVNVIDVFGDFPVDDNKDGVIDWTSAAEKPTHVLRWRTLLLAAAGQGGSELFVMDVTSPLSPVLLWHLSARTEHDGRFDTNADGTWETFDKANLATWALKWFDWDDQDALTDYIPTSYNVVGATDDTSKAILEEIKLGRYDYRNLGLTYGTAVGKIWTGGYYRYVAFISTNMVDYTNASPEGFKGIEVFAIDLITGQKLWQWERAYTRARSDGTPIADNTIPGRVALADVDSDGSVDRIYVGDLEGHLWELSATDGRNLNWLQDTAKPTPQWHSFPLFGTIDMTAPTADDATKGLFTVGTTTTLALQPLTSPIGLGRFTSARKELVPYLVGRLAIAQGAMGVDWSIAPYEPGSVFVVPVYPEFGTRVVTSSNQVDLEKTTPDPLLYGIVKRTSASDTSPAAWRIPLLTGERVFGMPRIAADQVIFTTSFGSFSGTDPTAALESGNLYVAKSTADTATRTAIASKSPAGVLEFQGKIVITTSAAISAVDDKSAATAAGVIGKPFDRFTPATFKTWEAVQP